MTTFVDIKIVVLWEVVNQSQRRKPPAVWHFFMKLRSSDNDFIIVSPSYAHCLY